MKKLFALLLIAGMVAVVACDPITEEQRAKEIAESTALADSLAQVQAAEQTAKQETHMVIIAVFYGNKVDTLRFTSEYEIEPSVLRNGEFTLQEWRGWLGGGNTAIYRTNAPVKVLSKK